MTLTNPYGLSRFINKVALVTGGASGIGRATAARLAAEGAHVIIVDLDVQMGDKSVSQINEAGGTATFMEVDLANDEAIKAMAAAVARQFSALHILINNAAVLK